MLLNFALFASFITTLDFVIETVGVGKTSYVSVMMSLVLSAITVKEIENAVNPTS